MVCLKWGTGKVDGGCVPIDEFYAVGRGARLPTCLQDLWFLIASAAASCWHRLVRGPAIVLLSRAKGQAQGGHKCLLC